MRLMAKGDYRDAAGEQALSGAGTRQGRRPEQNARCKVQAGPAYGREEPNEEGGLVPTRRPVRVHDSQVRRGIEFTRGIREAEGFERLAEEVEPGLSLPSGRMVGDSIGEIRHILEPHAGRRVVSLGAEDRAVLAKQRRGRDPVEERQSPFAAPVEIHDGKRAGQADIDLLDGAVLLSLSA